MPASRLRKSALHLGRWPPSVAVTPPGAEGQPPARLTGAAARELGQPGPRRICQGQVPGPSDQVQQDKRGRELQAEAAPELGLRGSPGDGAALQAEDSLSKAVEVGEAGRLTAV